jgi:ankyrin repeat protein
VAKNGYSDLIAKLINLSKFTRICQNLQPVMREVRNKRGKTQLYYFCMMGMASSVVRMLEMRSIDVEAKENEYGGTCLMAAAFNGHLAICRLLLDKGAQLEAKNSTGSTPLLWAAYRGHVEIVRLLCDRGADVEARNNNGDRPLQSAMHGHISVVKELIEERNAEINARDNGGRTALAVANEYDITDIAAYLISRGGIV